MSDNDKTPTWIVDAQAAADCNVGRLRDVEPETLAHELAIRLPVDDMTLALRRAVMSGEIRSSQDTIAVIVRVLTSDADAIDLTTAYRDASRALDVAGVPYAVNTAELYRPLDLAGRVAWLAAQRPIGARADADVARIAELESQLTDRERTISELRANLIEGLEAVEDLRTQLDNIPDDDPIGGES